MPAPTNDATATVRPAFDKQQKRQKSNFDYKPDSVPRADLREVTIIHLGDRYPELWRLSRGTSRTIVPYLVLHREGLALPSESPPDAVGSYPTFSPLPRKAVCFLLRFPGCGI